MKRLACRILGHRWATHPRWHAVRMGCQFCTRCGVER